MSAKLSRIIKDLRTKLEPKSARRILVGCSQKERAFQLRQPGTRKISVSVDVIIDETMCNFNEPGDNLIGLEEVVHFLDTPSSFPITLAGVNHNFSSSDFNGPSGPSEAGTWTEDFSTPHDSDPCRRFGHHFLNTSQNHRHLMLLNFLFTVCEPHRNHIYGTT